MNKEKNIILQIILSILFIFTILVSILLLYNEYYYLKYKKYFIDDNNGYIITNMNRLIILIILLLFVYANYVGKILDELEGEDTKADNLEITAAIFSVIGGFIVLYETLNYYKRNIGTSIENPVS